MTVNLLSAATVYSKYSCPVPGESRRETYDEAVSRTMGMHKRKFKQFKNPKINSLMTEIELALKEKKIFPAMRSLQFGGSAIEQKNAKMYNCSATYIDRPRAFLETFWMLLCGCGTGFSVQEHHVNKLPQIYRPFKETIVWTIEDTIEGWAYALGALLASYSVVGQARILDTDEQLLALPGHVVQFDYAKIRPKGSKLSTGNGVAPGPEPLRKALELVRSLLDTIKDGAQLRPYQACDILLISSDAVMSGGVRRSASIAIFSPWDMEMVTYKTGDWWKTHPFRGRANISALLLRNCDEMYYEGLKKHSLEWGEPGILWASTRELMTNPCGEIGLYPKHPITGESGWQVCNLTTMDVSRITTEEEFFERCHLASALGTMQAAYTSFPFLGRVTEDIIRNEALIGVSQTGVYDNILFMNNPKMLRDGARVVKQTNEAVASLLGIKKAARCTTIKPEGTVSLVANTSSGIHPRRSNQYIRRNQYSENEAVMQVLRRDAPELIENVWGYNSETNTMEHWGYRAVFAVDGTDTGMTEETVSGLEMLEVVKTYKKHWVDEGTRVECCVSPTVKHNVSNTLKLSDDEIDVVFDEILKHKDELNGVSILRKTGDIEYICAPFTHVYECDAPHEEVVQAFEGNNYWLVEEGISARTGIDKLELRKQYTRLWYNRCKAFDKPISWQIGGDDVVSHNQTVACAGGACEI